MYAISLQPSSFKLTSLHISILQLQIQPSLSIRSQQQPFSEPELCLHPRSLSCKAAPIPCSGLAFQCYSSNCSTVYNQADRTNFSVSVFSLATNNMFHFSVFSSYYDKFCNSECFTLQNFSWNIGKPNTLSNNLQHWFQRRSHISTKRLLQN